MHTGQHPFHHYFLSSGFFYSPVFLRKIDSLRSSNYYYYSSIFIDRDSKSNVHEQTTIFMYSKYSCSFFTILKLLFLSDQT